MRWPWNEPRWLLAFGVALMVDASTWDSGLITIIEALCAFFILYRYDRLRHPNHREDHP